MKQLKLVERDLILSNNKFTLVDNDDSLMQQITNQVTMWLGEWFANTTIGIDYIGFENKKFSDKEIVSSVTQSLYKNPNVSLVNSVIVSRNLAERKITLDANIETVEGNMVLTI
ncbi:MAG TPA: hypothetical protein PK079_25975 [Leptospiraceae bacterium]|nr:hypothetical protein [Leptospiraceae bacterium]HNA09521.1 hypothetical protein [Leptospiraceae bacterium]HNE56637.1 hypothetical protein [Leptospiraceae bacterium]HNF57462.1 hypothetical protein [Leptospiraceae bacterium]HNH57873.1 hypothetical protein [Leptospiraceae bacterium]